MAYKNTHICWVCEARKRNFESPQEMLTAILRISGTIKSVAGVFDIGPTTMKRVMDYYKVAMPHFNHGGARYYMGKRQREERGVKNEEGIRDKS